MKLYVSDGDELHLDELRKFSIVPEMEESSDVLILPGGLGAFYDMFRAIQMKKDVIVYNKDMYFTSVIKNMYEAHQKGKVEEAPSFYIDIESDFLEIIRKLEEKENGKTNDGKTSKLL